MLHMKTEKACGHCPMAMLCMARKKLPNVVFCRRCGCITFKHNDERYLCSQLREGVHSRIMSSKDVTGWNRMSNRDRRIAHTLKAVRSQNAEYEGCVRVQTRKKPHRISHIARNRWQDCVSYFRQTNGFDVEI